MPPCGTSAPSRPNHCPTHLALPASSGRLGGPRNACWRSLAPVRKSRCGWRWTSTSWTYRSTETPSSGSAESLTPVAGVTPRSPVRAVRGADDPARAVGGLPAGEERCLGAGRNGSAPRRDGGERPRGPMELRVPSRRRRPRLRAPWTRAAAPARQAGGAARAHGEDRRDQRGRAARHRGEPARRVAAFPLSDRSRAREPAPALDAGEGPPQRQDGQGRDRRNWRRALPRRRENSLRPRRRSLRRHRRRAPAQPIAGSEQPEWKGAPGRPGGKGHALGAGHPQHRRVRLAGRRHDGHLRSRAQRGDGPLRARRGERRAQGRQPGMAGHLRLRAEGQHAAAGDHLGHARTSTRWCGGLPGNRDPRAPRQRADRVARRRAHPPHRAGGRERRRARGVFPAEVRQAARDRHDAVRRAVGGHQQLRRPRRVRRGQGQHPSNPARIALMAPFLLLAALLAAPSQVKSVSKTGIPYVADDDKAGPPDLLAAIRARRPGGKLLNLDRMLLQSPSFAKGWNGMFGAIRGQLALPGKLRELPIMAIAVMNKADYEWAQHEPEVLKAGGTKEQLAALKELKADPGLFDPTELAALQLTTAMTRDVQVKQATIDKLRSLLATGIEIESTP